ncbi:MAG: hypothetical protein RLZZ299_2121 [Pseudomonadota bacterium]
MHRRARPLLSPWLVAVVACTGPGGDTAAPVVLVRGEAGVLAPDRAAPPRAAEAAPPVPAETAAFLAHATPDDVARGLVALTSAPGAPALSDPQRAALAEPLRRARDTRRRRDLLRSEARAAETAWLDASADLWTTLPPSAQERLAR